jgi:uncharacterized protein DUF1214/uncharacterized protein DUF1254
MNTKTIRILIAITLFSFVGCTNSKKSEKESNKITSSTESVKVTSVEKFFSTEGKTVTEESYPTDETSHQILKNQELVGVNKFLHKRKLAPTDNQPIVRMNRDTYYSFAIVNVSKGATITMPEIPEGKYMSVQPITEDHRIQVMKYGAGTFDLTTHTGTHLYVVVRLDATFTEAEAKEIQDKMVISANSDTKFSAVPVNKQSFINVENALKAKVPAIVKRDGVTATKGMFTDPRDESNKLFTKEKYEVGAALGWGGAQWVDNIYEVSGNYSTDSCYQLTFDDPEDKAFWSITVYDKKGFMFNDLANYSSNTATANADGTYTISFGCGPNAPNNLEIENPSGVFNLAIRHYQPTKKVREDNYRILPTMKVISKN